MTAPMIYIFDQHNECTFASPAMLGFFGKNIDELRGFGWLESVRIEERSAIIAHLEAAIQARACYRGGGCLLRSDGVWVETITSGVPLYSPETGSYIGHIGIVLPFDGPITTKSIYRDSEQMPLTLAERDHQRAAMRAYQLVMTAKHCIDDLSPAIAFAFDILLKLLAEQGSGAAELLN